jgi:hypothetical protein
MSYKVGMYFGVIIVMITFVVIAIGFVFAFANYQKRILLKMILLLTIVSLLTKQVF